MNAHKLASIAGMATMAASAMIHFSIPAVFAQTGQPAAGGGSGTGSSGGSGSGGQTTGTPRSGQPNRANQPNRPNQPNRMNQPGTTSNGQPVNTPGNNTQDPNNPGSQGLPNQTTGAGASGAGVVSTPRQRLFALDNSSLNGALADTGQRLANFETQLTTSNQQLLSQLGQARQLTGQRREDAMAEVMQQMLIQQRTMLQLVSELRMSLTGDLNNANNGLDANGNPINPNGAAGTTGNGAGVTNPNGTTTNPNGTTNNPNGTTNPANPPERLNPGRPTTNPNRLPTQPTTPSPQNPSSPETNPSRNPG